MENSCHISIMVSEVLELLRASEGGEFLDCTLGGGGHTEAILEASPVNKVTALDRDQRAIDRARVRLSRFSERLTIIHGPFSSLSGRKLPKFTGILADLGVSTDQIREGRGFSFADSESLDMRMDEGSGRTAFEIVNESGETELHKILAEGGVGPKARQITRAIIAARPIQTAEELASIVAKVPQHKKNIHPATLVFQAIRMAVNEEVPEIESLLDSARSIAGAGSRLAVITFHSIEDRVVTHRMRFWESGGDVSANWPGAKRAPSAGRVLTKKGITPSEAEISRNPSARSAKLRGFEFI